MRLACPLIFIPKTPNNRMLTEGASIVRMLLPTERCTTQHDAFQASSIDGSDLGVCTNRTARS